MVVFKSSEVSLPAHRGKCLLSPYKANKVCYNKVRNDCKRDSALNTKRIFLQYHMSPSFLQITEPPCSTQEMDKPFSEKWCYMIGKVFE